MGNTKKGPRRWAGVVWGSLKRPLKGWKWGSDSKQQKQSRRRP